MVAIVMQNIPDFKKSKLDTMKPTSYFSLLPVINTALLQSWYFLLSKGEKQFTLWSSEHFPGPAKFNEIWEILKKQ